MPLITTHNYFANEVLLKIKKEISSSFIEKKNIYELFAQGFDLFQFYDVFKLKKENFWIVGTDMDNSTDYREIDYSGKIALVIGNEGNGISKSVHDACDFIAKIPMYGKINSLNASVAAGIMIYEVIRSKK